VGQRNDEQSGGNASAGEVEEVVGGVKRMTAIVGMNLGDYVIIAADSRLTYYPPTRPSFFRDDKLKVKEVRSGLATGAGLGNLIDSVNERLDEEDPLHTDRIIDIIKEERETIPQDWLERELVRNSLEHETSWMFSYLTAPNIESPTFDSFQLRLASSHPRDNYTLCLYPPNTGALSLPGEVVPAVDFLHTELSDGIKPLNESEGLQDNISHHVTLCVRIIHAVAAVNETVSRSVQVGVHVASRRFGLHIGVSELWAPGADFSLTLRPITARRAAEL